MRSWNFGMAASAALLSFLIFSCSGEEKPGGGESGGDGGSTEGPVNECYGASDCAAGSECSGGSCVPVTTCTNAGDCAGEGECLDGVCRSTCSDDAGCPGRRCDTVLGVCTALDNPPLPGSGGAGTGGATGATGGGASGGATMGSGGSEMGTGGLLGTGGETYVPTECNYSAPPTLSVERIEAPTIAELGVPFDSDDDDTEGPGDWATNYGKTPELIPYSDGQVLDVLFQDQSSSEFAYVVHIISGAAGFEIEAGFRVASLGRIMGLTKDDDGNYYVATGVDEDDQVDETYPPNEIHRSNIVRIVKFDLSGCVLMESDVDMEREAADSGSEIIVNPMVAASSRLVWGGDRLLLVHGHNTEPDAALDGTRHQKAISTIVSALDGSATRTSTMWVSHSFDQRALFDGTGFVEMHLGDAYPRMATLGRYTDAGGDGGYAAYTIKGAEGDNNTFTRLGSIVKTSDPTFGLLAIFATERTPTDEGEGQIRGTRDLALARVRNDFYDYDTDTSIVEEASATEHTVVSKGQSVTNYVRWLTDLGDGNHAERPRMTVLDSGDVVVLYEQWINEGDDFDGTYALRIDSTGAIQAGPVEIPGEHHISRGDDIATLGGRAVFVTGGAGALHLNFVDSALSAERVSLP